MSHVLKYGFLTARGRTGGVKVEASTVSTDPRAARAADQTCNFMMSRVSQRGSEVRDARNRNENSFLRQGKTMLINYVQGNNVL